jgi:hypothetical protein
MIRVTRLVLTVAVLALVGLVCATASCGRTKRSKRPARPDAAVAARAPDAVVRPSPRRVGALPGLLKLVPARATWFVGLGRPAALVQGAARLWKLLAEIPDLGPPMSTVAQRLGKVLGGWPPPASVWRDVGIDPGGGVVLAGVAAGSNRPGGTLALVFTLTPQILLRRLVGPAGGYLLAGSTAQAALQGGRAWWCGPVSLGVACASSRGLLTEAQAPAARTLLAQLPDRGWRGVDVVGGWRLRAGHAPTTAFLRLRPWGLQARVRLRGGELARWLGWLGRGKTPRPLPADAVAALWLNLDSARISTLLGLLPASILRATSPGAPAPAALLRQCTGEAMLVVGPGGWRFRAVRQATGVGLPRPMRWEVSGWPVWVRAPAGSLVVAPTAAGSRSPAVGAPGRVTPRPLRALLARPAAVALLLPLMDPLELLPAAARVRLVAALAGLPAGERAFAGLVRGLLTLLGEAAVSVDKTPGGAVVRLALVTPAAGSVSLRHQFDRLWSAKWQGGGFFDRQMLARVASAHPGSPLTRLARALTWLRLEPPWSRWLTSALLRLLQSLSGAELSCVSLAARLVRCRVPLARLRSPGRWREMESVVLPEHRRRLRQELLDQARREGAALGGHCDRLAGRLENARAVSACLAADGCRKFARCLVDAFTPSRMRPAPTSWSWAPARISVGTAMSPSFWRTSKRAQASKSARAWSQLTCRGPPVNRATRPRSVWGA